MFQKRAFTESRSNKALHLSFVVRVPPDYYSRTQLNDALIESHVGLNS